MDRLELMAMKGSAYNVASAIAEAHRSGADTVRTDWLSAVLERDQQTIRAALMILLNKRPAPIVERLTSHTWRLSQTGRTLLMANDEQLPLLTGEHGKELSTVEPKISTGYLLDSASLRLESGKSYPFQSKPVNFTGLVPCSGGGLSIKGSLESEQPQQQSKNGKTYRFSDWARETAGDLAEVLRSRIHCARGPLVSVLAQRLDDGANPDQLELDLILYAAYVRDPKDGKTLTNKGGYVVGLVRDGEPASRAIIETLENARPQKESGAYSGYTDSGAGWEHPDLARVRELIARIDGIESVTQE